MIQRTMIKLYNAWRIKRRTDQNEIEERGLIDLDEMNVPCLEVFLGGLLFRSDGFDMLLAVFDDLS